MTERYCNIKCESLEDIKATCERHIENTLKMWTDAIDNDDCTKLDTFYFKLMNGTWRDLLEDVEAMIKEQHHER